MKIQYGLKTNDKPEKEIAEKAKLLWEEIKNKADGEFKNFEDFLYLSSSNFRPEFTAPSGLKHIVLIGIGGSSLGPKAIYDAIYGYFDSVEPGRAPKLHFMENVDSRYINALMSMLSKYSPEELAFVVVCKSGKTFETNKNLFTILNGAHKDLVTGGNTYVISVEGNHTWEWGKNLGANLFPMPQVVSGRFQMFGAIAVVILGLAGIDINKMLEGVRKSAEMTEELQQGSALRFKQYKDGFDIDVYFAFDERLKSMADWMCSITAESLGKNGGGITPITSIGSKDLHSIGQLYLQGPRDKFTTFLSLSDTDEGNLFVLEAIKKAYDDAALPYIHVTLEAGDPQALAYELGAFMQERIIHTVLLGGMMGINPYDQPGVELYKKYLQ